ncbi:MAG: hypothetical protein FWC93_05585 [Defluviitaleaceae bacterium]|nr:hypothetical protein [Defluviitaleaceae bacterium]
MNKPPNPQIKRLTRGRRLAIASLTLGIVALLCMLYILTLFAVFAAIAGIALAIFARRDGYFENITTAGLVCSIAALAFAAGCTYCTAFAAACTTI